ncbi:hypothetical protein BU24DRAFT_404063 [Aaosphaeria arxii CBS 175.79]|uniref:Uncharacterized protein n=1 Tax=Aaosphaeria arxii CBS 175.79 TaxID=1450172 RepID=A0A6A5Y8C3_9PLEO|nr:uncharacterized protein BU24DRAFT_404063 [Aaosphaeria arxii CBS 175.79]KAF2021001.1 hypothetical protein BU24DRAFT_404063 [Aaosphaeria arxii CBS 175.79]
MGQAASKPVTQRDHVDEICAFIAQQALSASDEIADQHGREIRRRDSFHLECEDTEKNEKKGVDNEEATKPRRKTRISAAIDNLTGRSKDTLPTKMKKQFRSIIVQNPQDLRLPIVEDLVLPAELVPGSVVVFLNEADDTVRMAMVFSTDANFEYLLFIVEESVLDDLGLRQTPGRVGPSSISWMDVFTVTAYSNCAVLHRSQCPYAKWIQMRDSPFPKGSMTLEEGLAISEESQLNVDDVFERVEARCRSVRTSLSETFWGYRGRFELFQLMYPPEKVEGRFQEWVYRTHILMRRRRLRLDL